MKDNFSVQAKGYSKFRPGYPKEMIAYLLSFVPDKNMALDVATGNGQVAAMLADYFKEVHAADISQNQLDHAIQKDNIMYSLQRAEGTNFADVQFDLITIAQAVHWFDFDAFYKEVSRILKPGGIVAVIGYGLFRSNAETEKIIARLYHDVLGSYWDPERGYLDENYTTIPFPYDEIYINKQFVSSYTWTFEQLIGYLETWSAVQHYIKKNNQNPLDIIKEELQDSWMKNDRRVTFPILLRLGKK